MNESVTTSVVVGGGGAVATTAAATASRYRRVRSRLPSGRQRHCPMTRECAGVDVVAAAVDFPSAQRTLFDRARVRMSVGVWQHDKPRVMCPGPHLLLYVRWRQGPTNHVGLGAPDQGA